MNSKSSKIGVIIKIYNSLNAFVLYMNDYRQGLLLGHCVIFDYPIKNFMFFFVIINRLFEENLVSHYFKDLIILDKQKVNDNIYISMKLSLVDHDLFTNLTNENRILLHCKNLGNVKSSVDFRKL
jgi:hypothetical protein